MEKPVNSSEIIFEELTDDQVPADCQTVVKRDCQNVSDRQGANSSRISNANIMVMTSVQENGKDGSVTGKFVPLECRKEKCSLEAEVMLETEFSNTDPPATDSSKHLEGNKILNTIPLISSTQVPLLQSQTITHSDGSDELIDVRVCDICGDTGREALLALCSMCPDGAEHTYCMRIKMDKVPEKDWKCEECNGMQKLKGKTQVVAMRGDSASNLSSFEELSRPSPRNGSNVKHMGNLSTKQSSNSFSLSGNKRTFEESLCPPKSPCRGVKTKFTRISSMKSMDKEKLAAPQGSSFEKRVAEPASSVSHRSLVSEKQFGKGSLYKSTGSNSLKLNMEVQKSKDDILPRIDTARESSVKKLKTKFPNKKLFKSLSFAGSVSSDAINPQFSYISESKGLISGSESERNLSKNISKQEKKNRPALSVTRSCSMKVRSETGKAVSFADRKSIHVGGNMKVESFASLAQEGKKHAKIPAKSVGETLASVRSSDAMRNLKKDVITCPGNSPGHPTRKAMLHSAAKDNNHQLAASGKILHPEKLMPTLAPAKLVLSESSVIPAAECIWKGGFKLKRSGKLRSYCGGVQAHVSRCASSKVHEVVSKFAPKLLLQEVRRSEIWPAYFRKNCPTEQDIALYFFAEDLQSYERSYKILLDSMVRKDLVLEANFDGIQLLILPSSLLPVTSQRWNSLFYLWGVCRARKVEDHTLHLPALAVATMNQELPVPVTSGPPNNGVSTFKAGGFSGSHPSPNSIQDPEVVHPLLPQSSSDQNCDHEASSMKCLLEQDETGMQPGKIQSVHDVKDETLLREMLPTDNILRGIRNNDRDIKCTTKAAVFPFGQSNGEIKSSLAINNDASRIYSNDICRDLSFPWTYNPASESCSRPDVASQSSFSIDSGPSGSSDGCAISERPSSSRSLNLDLCLGFSSQPEEGLQVDLNLLLGFPGIYQPENYSKDRNTRDENISLALSLGMPCSNA